MEERKLATLLQLGLDDDLVDILYKIVDAWNTCLPTHIDFTSDEREYFRSCIHDIEMLFAKIQMRRDNPKGWA